VVRTQRALRADASLDTQAARRLCPAEEAELIAGQIARDAEFGDPTISPVAPSHSAQFARDLRLLTGPV